MIRPKTTQVRRQSIRIIKYVANGTKINPPTVDPAEITEIAVALRRWNHLDTNTAPVVIEPALMAIDIMNPNIKRKYKTWNVSDINPTVMPIARTPMRISFRPPIRSYACPRIGWVKPLTRIPTAAANDMTVRLHPNSVLIGRTKTPIAFRAPIVTMMTKNVVATMSQP